MAGMPKSAVPAFNFNLTPIILTPIIPIIATIIEITLPTMNIE